ncbi:MAG: SMI1/KNR4 family protein [Promethearchaeota archaeon]
MDFSDTWNKFKDQISVFPIFKTALNPGCKKEDLIKFENRMKLKLPNDLKTLYLTNNGQKGNVDGIFKASSGYSKFSKLKFLEINKIVNIIDILNSKNVDVFTPEMIPFAADDEGGSIDDIYCIDSQTEEIYLLWVATIDWTLPNDWQTIKLKRAENLIEFIEFQSKMY